MISEFAKIHKFKRLVQSIGDHTSNGGNLDHSKSGGAEASDRGGGGGGVTAHHQQQQPESRNDSEPAAAGSTDFAAAAEAVDKRKKARQRWKILCLVKASDTVADETARKERVQEKVDDWMRTMVRITKFHLP